MGQEGRIEAPAGTRLRKAGLLSDGVCGGAASISGSPSGK